MQSKYDPHKHRRQSMRLAGYDYTGYGAYFVTICAYRGQCIFGKVEEHAMLPNDLGRIVTEEWRATGVRRQSHVRLDAFQLMPNHFHAIIWIIGNAHSESGASRIFSQPQSQSLSTIIGSFKAAVTRAANDVARPIWQRNYYDHIIRNDTALARIRTYIDNNPAQWAVDKLYPDATPNPFNRLWRDATDNGQEFG
ncbi:MAG: hypothetical protein M9930_22855 [Anaerolineae bacterium]|nr:hypothetical protein [Anaerolineae bacterium]